MRAVQERDRGAPAGEAMSQEVCSVCGRKMAPGAPTDYYPWRTTIVRNKYVVCSPRCAFDLGTRHAKAGLFVRAALAAIDEGLKEEANRAKLLGRRVDRKRPR
jgi:hypothetical protein